MANYYKLVALNDGKKDWMIEEIRKGRLRFGWSSKGMDLRVLKDKENKNPSEKIVWRMSQFIINRLKKDDILIVQLERPLRKFMVVKVVEVNKSLYDFDGTQDDFNHIIHCEPITYDEVDIESKYLSKSFRHDLTKRGHYYAIYNENTIDEIDKFINNRLWEKNDFNKKSNLEIELEKTKDKLIDDVIRYISNDWKSKDFEILVTKVFNAIDGVRAVNRDSGKGWDIIVEIKNPILNSQPIEIPVQCKNYYGDVNTDRPIEDLERCVLKHESDIAYLVILGNLTNEFMKKIEKSKENMTSKIGKAVEYEIINERDFANLYLSVVDKL